MCRLKGVCSSHRYVYVLAARSTRPSHRAWTDQLTAQIAAGGMAGHDAMKTTTSSVPCGDPAVVYVDASALGKTKAAVQLAADLVDACALQAAMQQVDEEDKRHLQHSSLDRAVQAVASEAETEAWKVKCRCAFGAGFCTSFVVLSQMGACEARLRHAGRLPSLSSGLLEFFGSTM